MWAGPVCLASFCEWLAGLHLAGLSPDQQSQNLQKDAWCKRWRWIISVALSAARRQRKTAVVELGVEI
ncbi:MAG: hypothetical protein ACKO2P_02460 [Planctomycetota bacterium]